MPGVKRAEPGGPPAAAPEITVVEAKAAPARDSLLPVDMRVQHHVDRGEIGQGGMGVVRRVYDTRLLRDVAMKLLLPDVARSRTHTELFVEEAQIAGQLEHPNIVPIYELGMDGNGTAYFTMKVVRGVSLHSWLYDPVRPVGEPARITEGLDIFVKVCDAVSFAHSRGVIHRDLKPSNVMVGEFGEVYLMDWGLAKLTGKGVSLPRGSNSLLAKHEEGAVGTPGYMAPEQARGKFEEQDERTDVFGLGAILYQIATGKPPYPKAGDRADRAAEEGAFTPPEEALAGVGVSGRLLRIIKKALSRDRNDRHASAVELKTEVKRFVRGGFHLPRCAFAAGTRIVVEGDVGDAAYIIVRGECMAYRTVDGQRKVLRRFGRGDTFGELAIISNVPRTATVEAVDAVTLLVVTRAALEEELGVDSWVASLVRSLANRFRELEMRE